MKIINKIKRIKKSTVAEGLKLGTEFVITMIGGCALTATIDMMRKVKALPDPLGSKHKKSEKIISGIGMGALGVMAHIAIMSQVQKAVATCNEAIDDFMYLEKPDTDSEESQVEPEVDELDGSDETDEDGEYI